MNQSAAMSMDKTQYTGRMHPKKFALLLMIVSMLMLFAGLTSALIVRKAEGNWFNFELPVQFIYSTVAVVISSITMWFAFKSAKSDEIKLTLWSLIATALAGGLFVYFQYAGWMNLASRGIYFVPTEGGANGMMSGAFIIALVALHLLHLLGGLVFLLVVIVKTTMAQVHKKELLSINLCNTYWHFVGLLWIYLYTFLYFATQS